MRVILSQIVLSLMLLTSINVAQCSYRSPIPAPRTIPRAAGNAKIFKGRRTPAKRVLGHALGSAIPPKPANRGTPPPNETCDCSVGGKRNA